MGEKKRDNKPLSLMSRISLLETMRQQELEIEGLAGEVVKLNEEKSELSRRLNERGEVSGSADVSGALSEALENIRIFEEEKRAAAERLEAEARARADAIIKEAEKEAEEKTAEQEENPLANLNAYAGIVRESETKMQEQELEIERLASELASLSGENAELSRRLGEASKLEEARKLEEALRIEEPPPAVLEEPRRASDILGSTEMLEDIMRSARVFKEEKVAAGERIEAEAKARADIIIKEAEAKASAYVPERPPETSSSRAVANLYTSFIREAESTIQEQELEIERLNAEIEKLINELDKREIAEAEIRELKKEIVGLRASDAENAALFTDIIVNVKRFEDEQKAAALRMAGNARTWADEIIKAAEQRRRTSGQF